MNSERPDSICPLSDSVALTVRQSSGVYVAHEDSNINHSSILWTSPCGRFAVRLKDVKQDATQNQSYICEEENADELLHRFCQQIHLSANTYNVTYLAISVIAQNLFSAYVPATGAFDPNKLGFGIRCMQTVDQHRLNKRLRKQSPEGVPLNLWGTEIFAHANQAMVESLGVVHWSVQSFVDKGWACVLMLDIRSPEYKKEIGDSALPVTDVICGACEVFYKALQCVQNPGYNSEHAKLLRVIGKGEFDRQTQVIFTNEVLIDHTMGSAKKIKTTTRNLARDDKSEQTVNKESAQGKKSPTFLCSVQPEAELGNNTDNVTNPLPQPNGSKKNRQHRVKRSDQVKAKSSQAQAYDDKPQLITNTTNEVLKSSPTIVDQTVTVDEQNAKADDGVSAISPVSVGSTLVETASSSTATVTTRSASGSQSVHSSEPALPTFEVMPLTSIGKLVFRFDHATLHLKCRLGTCLNVATSLKPNSTICPSCGIYSYVRYCSPEHLQADMRRHYCTLIRGQTECNNMAIPFAVDDLTIGTPLGTGRPYISQQNLQGNGYIPNRIIERHRQAVFRSIDIKTEYFVFDDIDYIPPPPQVLSEAAMSSQKNHLQRVRGTGNVCAKVSLPDTDPRKLFFNASIDACLRLGLAAGSFTTNNCGYIFDVIVEQLKKQNEWDEPMCDRLCVQMGFEFGYRVPEEKKFVAIEDNPNEVVHDDTDNESKARNETFRHKQNEVSESQKYP